MIKSSGKIVYRKSKRNSPAKIKSPDLIIKGVKKERTITIPDKFKMKNNIYLHPRREK